MARLRKVGTHMQICLETLSLLYMDVYGTTECSLDAASITNRLLHLPKTLPYIDRPNQLLHSSEIGPIEEGCSAWVWEASLGSGSD